MKLREGDEEGLEAIIGPVPGRFQGAGSELVRQSLQCSKDACGLLLAQPAGPQDALHLRMPGLEQFIPGRKALLQRVECLLISILSRLPREDDVDELIDRILLVA